MLNDTLSQTVYLCNLALWFKKAVHKIKNFEVEIKCHALNYEQLWSDCFRLIDIRRIGIQRYDNRLIVRTPFQHHGMVYGLGLIGIDGWGVMGSGPHQIALVCSA